MQHEYQPRLRQQMKITPDVRKYAAEQGIAEEKALDVEVKSKEFVEKGAEVYAKV